MSDGMSEYWRAKRAYEKEEKIKKQFLDLITALLKRRPTFRVSMQQMDKDGFAIDETTHIHKTR